MGKTPDKLTNAQLRTLLVALKCTGNRALPTLKRDMLLRLMEWEARGACSVEEEVDAVTVEAVQQMNRAENEGELEEEQFKEYFNTA